MQLRIAVIDDEITVCRRLKQALEKDGYDVEAFQKGESFWGRMVQEPFNIIFLDLNLPDVNGIDVLSQIKKRYDNVEVVIITGYGSIDSAINAIKIGA